MSEVLDRYLGDGVYVRRWNDGYEIYTSSEQIYLEPEIAVALIAIITKDMKPK